MTAVTSDDCVWTITRGNSVLHIVIVVDDFLQATNDESLRQEFIAHLRTDYTVTEDGDIDYFLGIGYERQTDWSLIATQTGFIDRFIKKFGLTNAKPAMTPMETTFR
eukprot:1332584-Rhodomonas_salina.1